MFHIQLDPGLRGAQQSSLLLDSVVFCWFHCQEHVHQEVSLSMLQTLAGPAYTLLACVKWGPLDEVLSPFPKDGP